jgi:hypothetical protein
MKKVTNSIILEMSEDGALEASIKGEPLILAAMLSAVMEKDHQFANVVFDATGFFGVHKDAFNAAFWNNEQEPARA